MTHGSPSDAPGLRIGTRGSDLALWQAHHVRDLLTARGVDVEITVIKTQGDRIDDVPLAQLEGKGFFTKELEDALLERRVDLAVHSMKDLATEMPAGLILAALIGREDPAELLLARAEAIDPERERNGAVLPLRDGARVGTSAARRQAQIKDLRPDLELVDLRGNVPTRVRKLREGGYDAILLALAGVTRLELDLGDLWTRPLPVTGFVPAPAQGMLALQCRDEDGARDLLRPLHCAEAARAVEAERRLLTRLEGGCQLPFGVNVRPDDGAFRLEAFWQGEAAAPLRLSLAGPDPEALADEAFDRIAVRRSEEDEGKGTTS